MATREKKRASTSKKIKQTPVRIVAIGASAGGLEAVSELLKNLPAETGMVFFYVQHLSPDRPSNLAFLLASNTKMKVQEVSNMLKAEPNTLYVCTPNKEMVLTHGIIKLMPRNTEKTPYLPIDDFFNSLAGEYKENVVGIILSGNAMDGTQGLKAIKKAGGMTFAQDSSAKNNSMPKSAIAANTVDFILSPKEIARELIRMGKKGFTKRSIAKNIIDDDPASNDSYLKIILTRLHQKTGVDFSHYKMATVKRRLNYRMLHSGVATLKEYVDLLLKKNNEVDMLYKDLLINVTSFFRDAETFKYLKNTFLPRLLKEKAPDEALRIWVPACSTGEEAYSIAMLLTELQDNKTKKIPIQIFATDLSESAIRDARVGEYSQSDLQPVSKNRVKRFFTRTGTSYRVVKELREMCVFAPHNILSDPPFSRMDFISCCNLLIYFDTAAQNKALTTLNFALNDGGYLMLGKSETIGSASNFFSPLNDKFKIYSRKRNVGKRPVPELTPRFPKAHIQVETMKDQPGSNKGRDPKELDHTIDSVLLSEYMPACAVVNKDMDILKFRGSTSVYLSHASGNATLNILKMARPEFTFELRNALQEALKTKKIVHKSGIELRLDTGFRMMSLEVRPLKVENEEPLLLIVFILQEQNTNGGGEAQSLDVAHCKRSAE